MLLVWYQFIYFYETRTNAGQIDELREIRRYKKGAEPKLRALKEASNALEGNYLLACLAVPRRSRKKANAATTIVAVPTAHTVCRWIIGMPTSMPMI